MYSLPPSLIPLSSRPHAELFSRFPTETKEKKEEAYRSGIAGRGALLFLPRGGEAEEAICLRQEVCACKAVRKTHFRSAHSSLARYKYTKHGSFARTVREEKNTIYMIRKTFLFIPGQSRCVKSTEEKLLLRQQFLSLLSRSSMVAPAPSTRDRTPIFSPSDPPAFFLSFGAFEMRISRRGGGKEKYIQQEKKGKGRVVLSHQYSGRRTARPFFEGSVPSAVRVLSALLSSDTDRHTSGRWGRGRRGNMGIHTEGERTQK